MSRFHLPFLLQLDSLSSNIFPKPANNFCPPRVTGMAPFLNVKTNGTEGMWWVLWGFCGVETDDGGVGEPGGKEGVYRSS